MVNLKISNIRKLSPLNNYRYNSFSGHFISSKISPIFTYWLIKKGIKPNTITLFMIASGIIGAIMFSIPNLYFKIGGFLFFHLWFIMDCSDGEVARITKTFSKYGKEMDYMAHLINHPLMNLSLWLSYLQFNKYDDFYLGLIFISFISIELVSRSFVLFSTYLGDSKNQTDNTNRSFLKYIVIQFSIYPNFILIFPIFIIAEYFFDYNSLYVLLAWFAIFTILLLKQTYKRLIFFYNS